MLTSADVQTIRDIMGSYAGSFTDAELTSGTVLALTQSQILAAYPNAATEVDSGRLALIRYAQAYLIAAMKIEDSGGKLTARLGDMSASLDVPVDDLAQGWTARAWTMLKNAYPATTPTRKASFFQIAKGTRGGISTTVEGADRAGRRWTV